MSKNNTLSFEKMAILIIDALVDAGLLNKENFAAAVKIAATEMDVRRALGDF